MIKVKLDENFPPSCVALFTAAGFDSSSVFHQRMSGSDDDNLYRVCIKEERILITFDLDFANIIRYPSQNTKGIVVYRVRKKITLQEIFKICELIIDVLKKNEANQNLLIIDGLKLRIRKPEDI